MPTYSHRSRFPVPVRELFQWHERPGAFERLVPPWERVRVLRSEGGIRDGGRAVVEVRKGPAAIQMVAEHFDYQEGRQFCDRLLRGPFAEWTHFHRFEPDPDAPDAASWLEDEVRYRLPGGPAGQAVAGRHFAAMMPRLFRYRHERLRRDLERHAAFNSRPRRRVAVTGASGLVGRALCSFLTTGGHEVIRLVRRTAAAGDEARWDPGSGELEADRLAGVEAVVHLAGASVSEVKWTPARKELLRSSRVAATEGLCKALAAMPVPPRTLISASAVGYYGDRGVAVLDEDAEPGKGFLADLAVDWEKATRPAAEAGLRVARLRVGLVLSTRGGALARMLPIFLAGAGGPLGSGRQYMSWITLDDMVGAIHHLLMSDGARGAFNGVSPNPVSNAEFTRALARAVHRPAIFPVPPEALRMVMGELADEALLVGQRVISRRLLESGFRFQSAELEAGLKWELGVMSA